MWRDRLHLSVTHVWRVPPELTATCSSSSASQDEEHRGDPCSSCGAPGSVWVTCRQLVSACCPVKFRFVRNGRRLMLTKLTFPMNHTSYFLESKSPCTGVKIISVGPSVLWPNLTNLLCPHSVIRIELYSFFLSYVWGTVCYLTLQQGKCVYKVSFLSEMGVESHW